MLLADYYRADPRIVLLPIEHLTPEGPTPELAHWLRDEVGWAEETVALLVEGFRLYWTRSRAIADRDPYWPPPRIRNIAMAREDFEVRPYSQILNTSTWLLYADDLDSGSHPELVAWLLVQGDHMAAAGEVTQVAVRSAAWWLERSDAQCEAFTAAAERSRRPDAEALSAVAASLPWLRRFHHATLSPPPAGASVQPIPGTGLAVPRTRVTQPPRLVEKWERVARRVRARFHDRWRASDPAAVRDLCAWLSDDAPPLLVTGAHNRILWAPDNAPRIGALRNELRRASGAAVRAITDDLRVVAERTEAFLAALRDPAMLPAETGDLEQRGYVYMHRERRLIAYNLDEPGLERRSAPPLPYARAMLGARTLHEWAHLAVEAGMVPATVTEAEMRDRQAAVATRLEETIADASDSALACTREDLRRLGGISRAGTALARILVSRMPDFQANLLAQRFLTVAERETYVRQNVCTLRGMYGPGELWRMLIRYVYERQYLRFSVISVPGRYFRVSTGLADDLFRTGVIDEARFEGLLQAVGRICDAYVVDERWLVGEKDEAGRQETEARRQETEARRQETEARRQETEARRQKTEARRQKTE